MLRAICLTFIVLTMPAAGLAQESSGPPRFMFDSNLYPFLDPVDGDTDLTFVINARFSPRFSYFSYINFSGLMGDGDATFSRSEQNLRWSLAKNLPFDLNAQAIIVDGSGNDQFQLGLGWRLNDTAFMKDFFARINLLYRLSFYLKRWSSGDDKVWQMEHFFLMRFPWLSDRLYLSGFLDQSFDINLPGAFPDNPVVTEIQMGMRLFNNFYGIAEYRRNDFRLGNEENLAAGIEYKFRW